MHIKYVVSTMVFWWREHHLSFEQECEFLRSLGFGIEIWPTMKGSNDCRFIKRNWFRLKHATEGMTVSLASRDDGPTINDWREQIECAQFLEANIVADLRSLCISGDLGIADWDFVSEVVKMANDHNVELCIESGQLAAMLQVSERFDSVKFCLDTGFANIDPEHSFKEYVDKLAPLTTHLHLTDNYGQLDDHEPPGVRGGIAKENWAYLLKTLEKYNNDIIGSLEMFPCMPGTMIKHGKTFMFDVLGWPNPPQPQPGYDENFYRPI